MTTSIDYYQNMLCVYTYRYGCKDMYVDIRRKRERLTEVAGGTGIDEGQSEVTGSVVAVEHGGGSISFTSAQVVQEQED